MSETAEGKALRIRFDGARCIHSRSCVLSLPQVFKANVEGPWLDPDAAPPGEIAALAERCPSGAITVERLDGVPDEQPPGRNSVAVLEDGPYAVRGDLRLNGAPIPPRATLCRCGASASKPFCDGSHANVGFTATGQFSAPADLPAWGEPGPLAIDPVPNGPLKISGAHEVTCGTGRAVRRGQQAFLCRCGASATRPFCDGSHTRIGFSSALQPARSEP